jgi:hypothetical protein
MAKNVEWEGSFIDKVGLNSQLQTRVAISMNKSSAQQKKVIALV